MNFSIRKARESDYPEVLGLIKELALFEKAPEKVTNTVELMRDEKDYFHCLVAETDNHEIVGMAIYFFAYYTWVGKSLYLEDLYIKESYRRLKLGSVLLDKVFDVAKAENCKRVRWQVLKWNESAIKMYSKNGAEIDDEWLNCTVHENGIKNFHI
jgi:GNAT superfamily N-acetyltransferase